MITIERIRYFLSVAKCLSFTRAAGECFVSQTAISQQISQLEKELGVTLFLRQKKVVRLTAAGEHLLPMAQRLWDDYLEMTMDMEHTFHQRSSIRVVLAGSFEAQVLGIAIPAFRERHPKTVILPKKMMLEDIAEAFDAGQFDLAFHITGEIDDRNAYSCEVLRGRMGIAVATSHPLASQESVTQEELVRYPLGLFRSKPGLKSFSRQYAWAASLGYREDQILCADTVEEQEFMVSVGQCISVLPMEIVAPGMRVLPIRDIDMPYSLSVYWQHPSPELDEFVALLKEAGRKIISGERNGVWI